MDGFLALAAAVVVAVVDVVAAVAVDC